MIRTCIPSSRDGEGGWNVRASSTSAYAWHNTVSRFHHSHSWWSSSALEHVGIPRCRQLPDITRKTTINQLYPTSEPKFDVLPTPSLTASAYPRSVSFPAAGIPIRCSVASSNSSHSRVTSAVRYGCIVLIVYTFPCSSAKLSKRSLFRGGTPV